VKHGAHVHPIQPKGKQGTLGGQGAERRIYIRRDQIVGYGAGPLFGGGRDIYVYVTVTLMFQKFGEWGNPRG
jgi:hypothetical protein